MVQLQECMLRLWQRDSRALRLTMCFPVQLGLLVVVTVLRSSRSFGLRFHSVTVTNLAVVLSLLMDIDSSFVLLCFETHLFTKW